MLRTSTVKLSKTKNDVIVMIKKRKKLRNILKKYFSLFTHPAFSRKFGQFPSYSSKGDKSVQTNCWKVIMSPAETYLELVS